MKKKGFMANIIARMQYRYKIMAIILIFTIVPVVILGCLYLGWIWKARKDQVLGLYREKLKSSVEYVDNTYRAETEKMTYISENFYISQILNNEYSDNMISILSDYQMVRYIFEAVQGYRSDASKKISIYGFNKWLFTGDYIKRINDLDVSIKDQVMSGNDYQLIWKNIRQQQGDFICIYKKILSIDGISAIMENRIPFYMIQKDLAFEVPRKSFLIYVFGDGYDYNVIGKDKSISVWEIRRTLGSYFAGSAIEGFQPITVKLKTNNHYAALFVGKSYIAGEMKGFIVFAVAVVLLLLAIIFFVTNVVSKMLTKRLTMLITKVNVDLEKLIEGGMEQFKSNKDDEFDKVMVTISELIEKIREYYYKIADYETEQSTLKVELLQASLNPHFLYNTLAAIKWVNQDERLWDVIDSIVRFYRLSLNKGYKIIRVDQELEMIDEYVKIQKFAYNIEFIYRKNINPQVLNCMMIKNILQPVVENSILHGIRNRGPQSCIDIRGWKDENKVYFEVSDNGIGMEEEKVKQVLAGESKEKYGGYGIKNVKKSIETLYGSEYGIDIRSIPDGGTTVIMTIPFLKEETG